MDRQNSKTNGKSNIKQTVTHKNSHTHTKENNKRRKKRKGNPKQRGIKPTNKLINENKHYKTDQQKYKTKNMEKCTITKTC